MEEDSEEEEEEEDKEEGGESRVSVLFRERGEESTESE